MSRFPKARFLRSAAAPAAFGDDSGAEVAIAGRSNSGKSSALNAIVGRRNLARTSRTPGRTQQVNLFELEPGSRLADLPGYGFAAVPAPVRSSWARLMEAYFTHRRSLCGVMLVVDARRGFGPDDETMLAYAEARGLPVRVLLTKADKLSRSECRSALKATQEKLAGRATAQLFSAHAGDGLASAQSALGALLAGRPDKKIPGDP
jgi:GTP-binding protein